VLVNFGHYLSFVDCDFIQILVELVIKDKFLFMLAKLLKVLDFFHVFGFFIAKIFVILFIQISAFKF